jgi:hypothetical protein
LPPPQNLWVLSDSPWVPNRLYGAENGGIADIRHRSERLVLVPSLMPGLRDALLFTRQTTATGRSSRNTRSRAILRGFQALSLPSPLEHRSHASKNPGVWGGAPVHPPTDSAEEPFFWRIEPHAVPRGARRSVPIARRHPLRTGGDVRHPPRMVQSANRAPGAPCASGRREMRELTSAILGRAGCMSGRGS